MNPTTQEMFIVYTELREATRTRCKLISTYNKCFGNNQKWLAYEIKDKFSAPGPSSKYHLTGECYQKFHHSTPQI